MSPVRIALALLALAAVVWVGLTYVAPGSDPLHSLAWGAVLGDGVRPLLTSQLTPATHPLPIGVGLLLSPLSPTAAYQVYSVIGAATIALLIYAIFRLARSLAGARAGERLAIGAGALALILILIRPRFELYALQVVVEVPFAALIMLALALVAESPRERPWLPLTLLALAGLLRPEAWALGILYCAWLAWEGVRGRELALVAAIALAAPALWFCFDVLIAQDALNSIDPDKHENTARDVGFGISQAEIERAEGPEDILPGRNTDIALSYVRTLAGDPLALIGLLVMITALLPWPARLRSVPRRSRFALVAGVAVLLVAQNVILAELGSPIGERYLVTPALLLVLLACSAVWLLPRPRAALAGAAALVALVVFVNPEKPAETLEKPGDFRGFRAEHRDVLELASLDQVHGAVNSGCGRIGVGGRNRGRIVAARPLVAMSLGLDLPRIKILRAPRGKHNQSNFRRDLPTGPPPFLRRGIWVYRGECLSRAGPAPKSRGTPEDRSTGARGAGGG